MKDAPIIIATVIVPHYNDPRGLDLCLAALDRQTIDRAKFQVVVADNGSELGTEGLLAVIAGRATLTEVRIRGAGPARNGGVDLAVGEFLAFTDSDCIPEPGWLAAGLAALAKGDIVGGRMTVLVRDRSAMTPCEAFEAVFAFDNADYVLRKHFSVTANLFVRRSDFAKVGGFKSGVSEDLEWCRRARSLGLRIVYEPEAVVGHPARHHWMDLRKKWRRLVSEQYQLISARPMGTIFWIMRSWALPASILPGLIKIAMTKNITGLGPRLSAAAILIRLRLWRFVESHRTMLRDPS